jgi:hypothetical protein
MKLNVQLNYVPSGDTPILQSVHITPAKSEKHSANTACPASANRA